MRVKDSQKMQYILHPNAFGLSIKEEKIQSFINKTDNVLKDMQDEAIYYVDYIFEGQDCNPQIILDIANMSEYWGMGMDEPLIAINKLKVTKDMVNIYRKSTNTIKINLNTGYMELDIVGKCNQNEWMGNITPQIFVEDLNIIDSSKYYF